MGTAKRQRQKANRQQRLDDVAKYARRTKSRRVGLRIGGLLAAVLLAVYLMSQFAGDDAVHTAVTTPVETIEPPQSTLPVGDKPEVSIPDEVPTELTVTVLTEGSGDGAAVSDEISVRYVGVLSADGTEFDNNYDSGNAFTFVLGMDSVIDGWDEGLVGATVGSRLQLDIPADLAYGDQARGEVITPGSALSFVIDVVGLTKSAESAPTT